jgi:ABC-type nitrate/sulfonate/bicarbonate transport system substrate-binding protein
MGCAGGTFNYGFRCAQPLPRNRLQADLRDLSVGLITPWPIILRVKAWGRLLSADQKGPRVHVWLADGRRFLHARPALRAVVALTAGLAAACSPAPAPPGAATQIRVSYPEGGAHLPLFYARDKGIFAKNGLDVTLEGLGGGPVAAAALQSGEIQIVDITGAEVVSADAAGADIIILATLTPVYPYVFEVSQAIASKDDLKGKIIAVRASGDATDIATRVLLKQQGLDPDKDVTILAVQQEGARMASLMAGQICCTVAQVQDRALLEKNNFHMLFDMTKLGIANAQGVIATKRAYAKDHPDVIQHFMDALIESIARSKNDRAGSLPVLKAQLKLEDDAIVAATYDFFIGEVVPNLPVPTAAQFADGIAILSKQNDKLRGFDVLPFIDTSYLDHARKRGLDRPQ